MPSCSPESAEVRTLLIEPPARESENLFHGQRSRVTLLLVQRVGLASVALALLVAAAAAVKGHFPSQSATSGNGSAVGLSSEQPCGGFDGQGRELGPCTPPKHLPSLRTSKRDEKKLTFTGKCVTLGENCYEGGCCLDAGMQCYEQSDGWAQCKATCAPGPDPYHVNGKSWTCKELGRRASGSAPVCSQAGEDCSNSTCCSGPGMQCYEKMKGTWATCKATCTPGLDLTDASPGSWTCAKLGNRAPVAAPWVAKQCSAAGADCRKTACCAEPGHQCYARDEFWAQCTQNCTAGPNPEEPWNPTGWSCKSLGSRTPAATPSPEVASAGAKLAPWVAKVCAKEGGECQESKCCSVAGMTCFEKNNETATCKRDCTPGPDLYDSDDKPWSCKVLGPRTPGAVKVAPHKKVAAWTDKKCAATGESCASAQCCQEVGMQCYTKNKEWATCLHDCEPGKNRSAYGDVDDKPWACEKLGMRMPRAWSSPSLFCFAVMRTVGYEADLIRDQMAKSAGIFACEEYAVFSSEPYQGAATTWWHPPEDDQEKKEKPLVPMYLGVGPLGRVQTIPFKPVYVGTSMDQTAGNTELFLRVWDKVREHGQYQHTDWTIKVDPDAVMLPTRVRSILKEYTGLSTYIVNCDKPGMAPMMFGSSEMYSKQAMLTFFDKLPQCLGSLGWKMWGEDYFMGKCLDMLGVTRTNQFSIVSDGVCKGVNCGDPNAAVFHPKKDSASWMACLDQAMGSR